MKALRCDFCNGNLIMDRSREFATCEFCGTKYTKETVQDKIQEIRGTVKIEGAVEAVTGEAEKERLLKNAETYTNLKEFDKAIEVYKQISLQFPDDYRGWFGIYTTPIERYFSTGAFVKIENNNFLKNAFNLCSDKSVFTDYFNSVINRYGNKIRLIPTNEKINLFFSRQKNKPRTIDSFTNWLLLHQKDNLPYFPERFKTFYKNLSKIFIENTKVGSIFMTETDVNSFKEYIKASDFSLDNVAKLVAKINLAKCVIYYPEHKYQFNYGSNKIYIRNLSGFFGKWIYSENYSGEKVAILSSRKLSTYMLENKCAYCGGDFKKLFNPICSKCGKPKNY